LRAASIWVMSGVPLSKTLRPAIRSRKCGSKVHY